jgi:hypothetical protein
MNQVKLPVLTIDNQKMGTPTDTDIQNRAKKQYHSNKNGAELIIRELMSNAFHAVIIQKTEKPIIELAVDEQNEMLVIRDNGCGFSEKDKDAIRTLDKESETKIANNLPSKGEGRLVLVHFAKSTEFSTISKDSTGNVGFNFNYPQPEERELFADMRSESTDQPTGTTVTVHVRSDIWKTFINNYQTVDSLAEFIKQQYLYFFTISNNLIIRLTHQGVSKDVTQASFEGLVSLETKFSEDGKDYPLSIRLINDDAQKGIAVHVIAHSVLVDRHSVRYNHDISKINKACYVFSHYFEDKVPIGGQTVNVKPQIIEQINEALTIALDKEFESLILEQKKSNLKHFKDTKKELKILARYLPPESEVNGYQPKSQKEYKDEALNKLSTETYNFLTKKTVDSPVVETSLYLYVKHRDHVIKALTKMVERVDADGNLNSTLEHKFHDLLFQRGTQTEDNKKDYHKHNLWLLDDKLAYFSRANSTTASSKPQSDCYLYFDDIEGNPNEIIIIELKRPLNPNTKADGHNPEKMLNQVIEYAEGVIISEKGFRGRSIQPKTIRFYAYIIASSVDIDIARRRSISTCHRIPFLRYSFYTDTPILIGAGRSNDESINLRIELLSYEDVEWLAKKRNKVFTDFLDHTSE